MKGIPFSFFIIVLMAFACTPKASLAVTEATIPSETAVSNNVTTIEAGHILFTTKCTRCHKEKPIEKWTYKKLRPTLAVMVNRAKLNNTEIEQLTAYVHANSKK